MTTRPTPNALADQLEQLAARLRTHGATVERTAPILAARGYPTSTGGSGNVGPRGNAELTSTEAAASRRDQFTGIDDRWHRLLTAGWSLATGGILLVDQVVVHADPTSAERKVRRPGSGPCGACGRIVAGTSNDRLRSGWCAACYQAWVRADRPDRGLFERRRWQELNPPETVHVDPTAMATWQHEV